MASITESTMRQQSRQRMRGQSFYFMKPPMGGGEFSAAAA